MVTMKQMKNLSGMILHPVKTSRKLLLGTPLNLSLISLAGFLLSLGVTQWINRLPSIKGETAFFARFFLSECAYLLLAIFIYSSVVHLTADLLKGAGRGVNLFLLFVISLLPLWLMAPAALIFSLLLPLQPVFTTILSGLVLWSVCLVIISIREIYRFSTAKAVLALLIPLGIAFFLGVTLALTGLPGCIQYIVNLLQIMVAGISA
jgi:Yip1 domain